MIAETRFVAAEDGSAWTEKFEEGGVEWFRFETRTRIAVDDDDKGASITIRTHRRMHARLLDCFRSNPDWRKQILKQNQDHAIGFFQSR